MAFQIMEKPRRNVATAVDYPAIIINTGKTNSLITNACVKHLGLKAKDAVAFDIMQDDKNPRKFAIKFYDEGSWSTRVTKAGQVTAWLGSFFVNKEIYLVGHKAKGEKGTGEKFICELEYNKKADIWVFELEKKWYVKKKKVSTSTEDKPKKKKKKKSLKSK